MAREPTMTDERRGVLHSWCVQADWNAPTVTGGEGAFFTDEHGRRYLDMSSLAECMNLGHQHPAVVRAIREQAERLCFVTAAWGAEPRARLAERLREKSGFAGGRVYFTLGGADANQHAEARRIDDILMRWDKEFLRVVPASLQVDQTVATE